MTRGIGAVEPIQQHVPEWLAVGIALVTQLGDLWFLTLLLLGLYWTRPAIRADVATVAAIALGGIGLYRGWKHVFELPRPDEPLLDPALLPWFVEPLYLLTASASGYGFPSGHATVSTIVYVGLAIVLGVGTRRQRVAVAWAIVCVVSLSRVALGVHYLVDVVVGVLLGAALLFVALELLERSSMDRPTVAFGLAVPLGAFYLVASGVELESVVLLGAILGALAGWQLVQFGRIVIEVDRPSAAVRPLVLRAGIALLAIAPIVVALEAFPLLRGSPYAVGGLVGLFAVAAVTLPVIQYSPRARRAVKAIQFWASTIIRTAAAVLRGLWRRARTDRD